jgi:hypothetical protein
MQYYSYGLQFSGVNMIDKFLEDSYNIKLYNCNDKKSCYFKHFRIYDNKNLIPVTTSPSEFYNNYKINTLEDLDNALGDFNHTNKYIIVYDNVFSWLLSIEQFAKQNAWMTKTKLEFLEDYLHFLNKWIQIKTDRVIFLNYSTFITSYNYLYSDSAFIEKLNLFFSKNISFGNCFYNINKLQLNFYSNQQFIHRFNRVELEIIKKHSLFDKITNMNEEKNISSIENKELSLLDNEINNTQENIDMEVTEIEDTSGNIYEHICEIINTSPEKIEENIDMEVTEIEYKNIKKPPGFISPQAMALLSIVNMLKK